MTAPRAQNPGPNTLAGVVLEPDDRSRFVVESTRGELTPIWRDDAEAARNPGASGEHWFDGLDSDPLDWNEVLSHAARLHALVEVAGSDRQPKDIHTSFGLSYANYLVLPRTLLQSMPEGWQHAFTALIDELHAAFRHVEQAEAYEVTAGVEVYVGELGPAEMRQLGITAEEDPEDSDRIWVYYDRAGDELDEHARVLVPKADPVPHYNRGRTHIEPRTAGPDD